MKVVLFCGGLGMRLRDYDENVPKPMVPLGYRPIIWHLMKYYATFGHTDFILCLGYKADKIKDYFLNYNEYISNDFTMSEGGRMSFSSTRVILTPHGSVAWSTTASRRALISSRFDKVSSRSIDPITVRKLVVERAMRAE